MRQILFADNDPDFLETRSEFLEKAGYKVIKATSVADAERCLRDIWTPVAILDIRLENDDDDKDWSGITLAKSKLCRAITKIILTNYPSPLVNALLEIERGDKQQRMVAVLDKKDGPEILIDTLETAFKEYVRINFSLTLDWRATSPSDLVRYIEPDAANERERLRNREEELEDLFRRLFYEQERIRLDRVLWKRDARVALTVFAFKGAAMDQFVVVCGQNARMTEEASRFAKFAPKAQGETSTALADKAETTHFAANAYTLANADLETIRSLAEVYRADDRKTFTLAMQNLFEHVLPAWHQNQAAPAERALEDLYCERLGLTAERVSPQTIRARWDALTRYLPEFKTLVPNLDSITALLQATVLEQPALTIKSPGILVGESILVDADGHVWLTDFADAGEAPRLWDFVALESTIRFDWVEEKELRRLQEVEKHLSDDSQFGKPETQGIESAPARQAVNFIQRLRRYAARAIGKECLPYHLGIFFHAARRVADFDLGLMPKPLERARLAHALLAMAMIAKKVGQGTPIVPTDVKLTLRLDKNKRRFELGNKYVDLTPQEFKLACYLFDNSGKTCTYEEILKQVFEDKYDEDYLQTMINRIRKRIEPDERSPRYILNVRSVGYRLVCDPHE